MQRRAPAAARTKAKLDFEVLDSYAADCNFCQETLHPANTEKHEGSVQNLSCSCRFHAECLVKAIQQGRCKCPCGLCPLDIREPVRVTIPKGITRRGSDQSQKDPGLGTPRSEELDVWNWTTLGTEQECPICCLPLRDEHGTPIGKPATCHRPHEFHIGCLLDWAYTPCRPFADLQVMSPERPRLSCPCCREDFCMIEPLPVGGAPPIFIHFEALEKRAHRGEETFIFGNSGGRGSSSRGHMHHQQESGWKTVLIGGVVAVVGGILLALILGR